MSKSHRTFPSVCGTRHDDRFYVPIEEEHSAVLGRSCATRLVSFNWLKVSVGFVHCVTLSSSSSSSSWQILAVLLPFSIILAIYFRRRNAFDLHNAILGLLFSVLITGVITDAIKDAVGRPRPDFYWRCFPDGVPNYEPNTTRAICHGEKSVIREGHKSFPSGHSSWSFAGLGFLSWYLAGKLKAFDGRGHVAKLCIVFLPLLAAALVAISRVDDYWHHWQDVFTGGFLGLVVASFCYLQFFPPPYDLQGWLPHAYLQAVSDARDNVPLQPFAASSLRTRPSEVESVAVASGHQDGRYARNTSTILDSMEAGRRNGP
ncbi:hypothetical protein ZIOFF_031261 [Zingiber officinale]|uniref:Phosphatidic acid phosphatase type 2/haloperoxidase domain-containing protein n=1 Tax=Zingiber officinale TaxID=94328 RepID=A0A8J5GTJ6_ZINOF|nr:hypothetical protein ZIOFF_031261 [Zingiber officinale]